MSAPNPTVEGDAVCSAYGGSPLFHRYSYLIYGLDSDGSS
jgi:hypothetical protein